jgi:hypothetical protein
MQVDKESVSRDAEGFTRDLTCQCRPSTSKLQSTVVITYKKAFFIALIATVFFASAYWGWHHYTTLSVAIQKPVKQAPKRLPAQPESSPLVQDIMKRAVLENSAGAESKQSVSKNSASPSNAKKTAVDKDPATEIFKHWMAIMNDPEAMRLASLERQAQAERRYAAFFNRLNISPEDRARITKLLVEKRQVAVDLMVASAQKGVNPLEDTEQFDSWVKQGRDEAELRIKEALGDGLYKAYREYERSYRDQRKADGQMNVVTNLQMSAEYQRAPLSADQGTQLLSVLEKQKSSDISDQVISEAQNFLTPAQMRALLILQEEQLAAELRRTVRKRILPIQ